mmetsp:Transcript_37694/g.55238  ORF Transcript_37694/g.55238 Transcript_37694/m.55238 type:complete len:216 (-) Transcript_37694:52-699(-)
MTRFASLALVLSAFVCASAYTTPHQTLNRRDVFGVIATSTTAALVVTDQPAQAFDGSGSSAYSGRNAASKAALKKSYEDRVAADVKDFNTLGAAINKGETDGDAWVNFFIQFQRREPDSVGRTYAAQADLVGTKDGGGCGLLFSATFAKPGKPSENIPQVKKFLALAKTFDDMKAAGKKGDAARAKVAWTKSSVALSDWLVEVEMPGSLTDALYQ